MSSKLSSTAVSSHSSTPGFLLTDEYLAADLSDSDEPDTLPSLTLDPHSHHSQHSQHGAAEAVEEDGTDDADEDGTLRLAVDDETRAQLREIQGVLSAQLEGKPHPSHFSTVFVSRRAAHDRLTPAVTSSAASVRPSSQQLTAHNTHSANSSDSTHTSPASQSSLLALLASKDADLQLAAQLGAALSDKTETLEQYCRNLEQQLTSRALLTPTGQPNSHTAQPNGTHTAPHTVGVTSVESTSGGHRTSHSLSSVANGSTAEEEVARLRLELGRLERRMAVSEGWHRDALKVARNERRETEERVQEVERESKRREADEVERRTRDEEERVRLTEEVEQLRAMEQQRLVRDRELRRQRELKEKEDEDEQRHRRDENQQAEQRWRDDQRRREEVERRCRTLEKQRDDAIERAAQQTKEFEQRRRRWEHDRGRAVEDELERHRSQAKALADQYRAVEEQMKQQSGQKRTLSVDTSGRLSPSPSTPPSSGDDGRDRRAVLVSHSTQTPGEWMEKLDRAESAMTIPKGQSENERVMYSPLQFTMLSPSTVEQPTKPSTEEKQAVATANERADNDEQLVIPLSLVTPQRQSTRSPYLSPQSPLPTPIELTEEDERALIEVVAPTIPLTSDTHKQPAAVMNPAVPTAVSFLSPLYSSQLGASSSSDTVVAAATGQPVASAASPATPARLTTVATMVSPFLRRPLFRSPLPTAPAASFSSSTASSPLLFTLHTSHPSSIRAHLTASSASSPLPPLPRLSTPLAQLQSSLLKQTSTGSGSRRLQPCTDDATRRVFSVLMQTRMGEGVAGFS